VGQRRTLADLIIGAHALRFADTLLTSDTRIYGTELKILAPEAKTR
jgi:predicted nucleic acid-binding protein